MSACYQAVSRLASIERLWSDNEYSMSDFIQQHGQRIPVIICIAEGYSGIDDLHSVSVEDVRMTQHHRRSVSTVGGDIAGGLVDGSPPQWDSGRSRSLFVNIKAKFAFNSKKMS